MVGTVLLFLFFLAFFGDAKFRSWVIGIVTFVILMFVAQINTAVTFIVLGLLFTIFIFYTCSKNAEKKERIIAKRKEREKRKEELAKQTTIAIQEINEENIKHFSKKKKKKKRRKRNSKKVKKNLQDRKQ